MNWLKPLGFSVLAVSLVTALSNSAQAQITSGGDGTAISPNGSTIDITGGTQAGSNLFHNFGQFNVNAGQTANFVDPGVQNILGRVTGGNASLVNGVLQVTGGNANLYLMNPAGIIFGSGASLSVPGSFTATTANGIGFEGNWFNAIGSNDYTNLIGSPTSFAFTMAQPGAIANAGNLVVGQGQSITLLGGTVINTGTLTAPGGKITVAAVPGEKLVSLSQDGSLLSLALPVETGTTINALPFTPLSLPQLLAGGNLNNATGVTVEGDVVKLTGSGVAVPTEAGTAIVSNAVDVAGATGGTVHVLGNKVGLVGANIDASGTNGGGTVLVGGDYKGEGIVPNAQQTYVSRDSLINVDARVSENAGKAIFWADGTTQFYGTATARGGSHSGNGGFVEISGKQDLMFQGNVNTTANNGTTGTLLLDPASITILPGVGDGNDNDTQTNSFGNDFASGTVFEFDLRPSVIYESELEGLSASTFIYIGAGNITIQPLSNGRLTFQPGSGGINFVASDTFSMSPGDTIETQGSSLFIKGNTLQLGNLSTSGGNISLQGDLQLRGNANFSSAGGIITLGGENATNVIRSDATPRNLIVDAGAGNIKINSDVLPSTGPNNLTLRGNSVTINPNTSIRTAGDLRLETQSDLNLTRQKYLGSQGNLILQSQSNVSFVDSSITNVGGDFIVVGQNIRSEGSVLSAGGDLRLQAAQTITTEENSKVGNRLYAGLDLILQGQAASLQGFLEADRNLIVNVAEDLKVQNARLTALQDISLTADKELALGFNTAVTAGQDLRIFAPGTVSFNSSIKASRDLTLEAETLPPDNSYTLDAGRDLSLDIQRSISSDLLPNLKAGADTVIRSLGSSIEVNNRILQFLDLNGDLTLDAATDLTLKQTQIQVPGNVTLLAGGKVEVQDGSTPAIAQAGGNLTIQGNTSINLEGYRDPDSRIETGGNLSLISDGAIVVNTRLISHGSTTAQQVAGGSADLEQTIPSFNTVLSSMGDVTFGNYNGPSLKVETLGSIKGGDITIWGSNPSLTGTDPDIALLTGSSSLILRAGVASLQNSPNLLSNQSTGGTSISQAGTTSSPGNITVGSVRASGPVILSAPGDVTTGSIKTEGSAAFPAEVRISAGGNITATLSSDGSIQPAQISALGFGSEHPAVVLSAENNILVGDIASENENARQGSVTLTSTTGGIQVNTIKTGSGGITVNAAQSFRVVGAGLSVDDFRRDDVVNDPELLQFLVDRGFSEEQLKTTPYSVLNRFRGTITGNGVVLVDSDQQNYSLKVNIANANPDRDVINIRIGDASQKIVDQVVEGRGRVVILGDSQQPFRLGPSPKDGLLFVPDIASNQLEDYNPATNNFAFKWNASQPLIYSSSLFPLDASGLAGAIAIDDGTNASLVGSLQYRSFTPTRGGDNAGGNLGGTGGSIGSTGSLGGNSGGNTESTSGGNDGGNLGGTGGSIGSTGSLGGNSGGNTESTSGGNDGSNQQVDRLAALRQKLQPDEDGQAVQQQLNDQDQTTSCNVPSTIASAGRVLDARDRSNRLSSPTTIGNNSCNSLNGSSAAISETKADDTQILKLLDEGVR